MGLGPPIENGRVGIVCYKKEDIWIVVNAEDTQGIPNRINAKGCRELCEARIDAQADMLYGKLLKQAKKLENGARIIMHQGGRRECGGQLLRAAGRVSSPVQNLTAEHVQKYLPLWETTQKWYNRWSRTSQDILNELIIFYKLRKANRDYESPTCVRPMPGNKFIQLHLNCHKHNRCDAYEKLDSWWHDIVGD